MKCLLLQIMMDMVFAFYYLGVMLLCTIGLTACSENMSICESQLEFEESSCGIRYKKRYELCEDSVQRCRFKCVAGMTCSERRGIYFNDAELSLTRKRCFSTCREGFACDGNDADFTILRCDGFIDCLDGTDESGCSYHVCADGQNVVSDAICDGYTHCADGSDEEGCGLYL